MRTLLEGTARRPQSRADRRAHSHCRTRRGCTTARIARLIGAIVAGGAASRFGGEPKGLHTVGGIRIIDRIAAALRPVTSELVIVTGARDASSWVAGARVIPDAWRIQGSLVGIHTALNHARGAIVVVAWDMPFVTTPLLELLQARMQHSPFAVIPEGLAGLEPFCAVYTPACLPFIEAGLAADDLKLSHMLERLPSYERVSISDVAAVGDPATLFFNVNTADDLATADRLAATL